MSRIASLIAEFGDPLRHIDRIPRTATEVFYVWTGVGPKKSLNHRERAWRRSLAHYLQRLAWEGQITRGITTENGYTYVAFWREQVDADDAPERA